jgi:hypothetical protein
MLQQVTFYNWIISFTTGDSGDFPINQAKGVWQV